MYSFRLSSFVGEATLLFHPLYDGVVHRGVAKQAPHVGVRAPHVVFDDFTTSEIFDDEAETAISFVYLVECGVGVGAQILQTQNTQVRDHLTSLQS